MDKGRKTIGKQSIGLRGRPPELGGISIPFLDGAFVIRIGRSESYTFPRTVADTIPEWFRVASWCSKIRPGIKNEHSLQPAFQSCVIL